MGSNNLVQLTSSKLTGYLCARNQNTWGRLLFLYKHTNTCSLNFIHGAQVCSQLKKLLFYLKNCIDKLTQWAHGVSIASKNARLLYFAPNIVYCTIIILQRNSENKLSVHIGWSYKQCAQFSFHLHQATFFFFFSEKADNFKEFLWISDSISDSKLSRISGKSLLKEVLKNQCLSFRW